MKVRADMGSTERDGVMASLQYEPSDFYHTTVDVYYSTMDQTNNARSIEVNNWWLPRAVLRWQFPAGIDLRLFGYDDQERHRRRGHAEHMRCRSRATSCSDEGRDSRRRLAQRIHDERHVVDGGRRQLLGCDA